MNCFLLCSVLVLFAPGIYCKINNSSDVRKVYTVRYSSGEITIPVTVVLDYGKQAEYVINMNSRSPTKSVTFYDFKQMSIAYKDMSNKECFIGKLTNETLQDENQLLSDIKNPVDGHPTMINLDTSRSSLTPTEVRNIAGQKIAMFCRKMSAWLLRDIQKRNRRQIDTLVNHYGYEHGSDSSSHPLRKSLTDQSRNGQFRYIPSSNRIGKNHDFPSQAHPAIYDNSLHVNGQPLREYRSNPYSVPLYKSSLVTTTGVAEDTRHLHPKALPDGFVIHNGNKHSRRRRPYPNTKYDIIPVQPIPNGGSKRANFPNNRAHRRNNLGHFSPPHFEYTHHLRRGSQNKADGIILSSSGSSKVSDNTRKRPDERRNETAVIRKNEDFETHTALTNQSSYLEDSRRNFLNYEKHSYQDVSDSRYSPTDSSQELDNRNSAKLHKSDFKTNSSEKLRSRADISPDATSKEPTTRELNPSLRSTTTQGLPPHDDRVQNVLEYFTPDEIIIDVEKLPQTRNLPVETNSVSNENVTSSTYRNSRFRVHHVPAVQTINRQLFNNRTAALVPQRENFGTRRHEIQVLPPGEPQVLHPPLPDGVAIYPRHPNAPYAQSVPVFNKEITVPLNGIQHHQRHHRKKSKTSSNCCSQGLNARSPCCFSHRHRNRSCCKSRRHFTEVSDFPEVILEKPASYVRDTCDDKKLCRTLYKSTRAVKVCRITDVPGC